MVFEWGLTAWNNLLLSGAWLSSHRHSAVLPPLRTSISIVLLHLQTSNAVTWNSLFKSTNATSAPLSANACAITRPNPLAPPVTIAVFPSKLKLASVRLKCGPPLPCNGTPRGRSSSSGYSTVMLSSVRAYWPSWSPEAPGSPEVVAWYIGSFGSSGGSTLSLSCFSRRRGVVDSAALKSGC